MKIGYENNQYGTLVSRHKCDACGKEFTVCPAVPDDHNDQWLNCLDVECSSYDPSRDVDKLFDSEPERISAHPVRHLNSPE